MLTVASVSIRFYLARCAWQGLHFEAESPQMRICCRDPIRPCPRASMSNRYSESTGGMVNRIVARPSASVISCGSKKSAAGAEAMSGFFAARSSRGSLIDASPARSNSRLSWALTAGRSLPDAPPRPAAAPPAAPEGAAFSLNGDSAFWSFVKSENWKLELSGDGDPADSCGTPLVPDGKTRRIAVAPGAGGGTAAAPSLGFVAGRGPAAPPKNDSVAAAAGASASRKPPAARCPTGACSAPAESAPVGCPAIGAGAAGALAVVAKIGRAHV